MPSFEALQLLKDPLLGGLLALVVSGVLLLTARALGPRHTTWAAALALGGGYLAGALVLCGRPSFPPHDAVQRLFYVTLAAIPLSILGAGRRWRWGVYLVLLSAAGLYLIPPPTRSSWTWPEATAWLIGLGTAGFLFCWALDDLAEKRPGRFTPSLLVALALGSAGVLSLSHNALLGQLSGIVAAALVPAVILGVRLSPAALVLTVQLPGLWLLDQTIGYEPPTASLLLLAATPVLAWVAWRLGPARPLSWMRGAVALAPAALALALVVPAVSEAPEEAGGYLALPAALPDTTLKPAADAKSAAPVAAPMSEEDNPFRRFSTTSPDR